MSWKDLVPTRWPVPTTDRELERRVRRLERELQELRMRLNDRRILPLTPDQERVES